MVQNAIATLEIIEAYPQDKYLPSFLVRGESEYTPDPDEWDEGLRLRRTK
jgi:hypothetical protein